MTRREAEPTTLTERQSWAILRVGALAGALALAVPAYYVAAAILPPVGTLLPSALAFLTTAVGLCVGLPATIWYAHRLERRAGTPATDGGIAYGVNDAWERENL